MADSKDAEEQAEVRAAARALDHDRYLAALLAPKHARNDLMTIAAFHGEVARVSASVQEPTIGAIRLQWWLDALDLPPEAEATGSPVADGLRLAVAEGRLARSEAGSMIDAYEALLRPGGLLEAGAVEAFCDAGQGAAFRLAAAALGSIGANPPPLINAAAQAYGRVQLLRFLPLLLSKGHDPFGRGSGADWSPIVSPLLIEARRWLGEVRRLAPLAPATIWQAVLPVALVEPYLAALEGLGSRIAFEQATISPLSRVWRIYIAKRRGRL